ncbi:hypothetical protein QBC37DRAFT_405117 [Rhypophila decipiens]|uniref:Uncharacterized protein n=1 Tax=Rhypophila decipiens TaxID=261697 RepID=A0AAN7B2M1_9PEZI|nr:hypothetical protein QBC37DRAFT_405117 [Rhypophila decipiens]
MAGSASESGHCSDFRVFLASPNPLEEKNMTVEKVKSTRGHSAHLSPCAQDLDSLARLKTAEVQPVAVRISLTSSRGQQQKADSWLLGGESGSLKPRHRQTVKPPIPHPGNLTAPTLILQRTPRVPAPVFEALAPVDLSARRAPPVNHPLSTPCQNKPNGPGQRKWSATNAKNGTQGTETREELAEEKCHTSGLQQTKGGSRTPAGTRPRSIGPSWAAKKRIWVVLWGIIGIGTPRRLKRVAPALAVVPPHGPLFQVSDGSDCHTFCRQAP